MANKPPANCLQRPPGMTHVKGYDYVLLVPMHIDNVSPPYVDRDFPDVQAHDEVYQNMLDTICRAYVARWHMG